MGVNQSSGRHIMTNPKDIEKAFTFPGGIHLSESDYFAPTALCSYSILSRSDPDRLTLAKLRESGSFGSKRESRAIGTLLGCAIGDTTGAPLEFSDVRYGATEQIGPDHPEVWSKPGYNRFQLHPGQWTDDTSMALCIADTLLTHGKLDLCDLRLRFLNWWTMGYNNAFGQEGGRSSVGLGGNISESFAEFRRSKGACGGITKAGDKRTSGNGSLMRLAPVPIFFAKENTLEECMAAAALSSLTTHQGDEAAECCRLLAYIIYKLINRDESIDRNPKQVLEDLPGEFTSPLYSVTCLAESKAEKKHAENRDMDLVDRNWRWKQTDFKYAPGRARAQPGYVGSYCMDALAMALHCAYTTDSFEACVIKAANMCGDADTVADIAGQIAGAMYGAESIPPSWIAAVERWDRGDIAVKAYKLYHRRLVGVLTAEDIEREMVKSESRDSPSDQ